MGVGQSLESRFPRGCRGENVRPRIRQQLESKLRSEFQKINPTIETIRILEIKCVFEGNQKLRGALVLAYGAVAGLDKAFEQFQKAGSRDAGKLLESEQYGVFQYDPSLTTLRKTLTIFASRRWRDYLVRIELTSPNKLSLRANGSYGDAPLKQESHRS
jgi:hypothetical protein